MSRNDTPRSNSFDEKKDVEYTGGADYDNTLTAGLSHVNAGEGPNTVEDDRETRRIMRKIDLRILPIASLLYLFSFLDRTAIGNAKVAGMNKELGITDSQYALALSIFFVPYGLFEVPSNLLLKKFGAKRYLPLMVMSWGLVMTLTGVINSANGLIATRVFLGLTEAGLFPGVSFLLSLLYPRRHIQWRIGFFFSAATIAGAFGGLLAYALSNVQTGSYTGWRWLFLVEGIATVVVGAISYFFLISNVDEAKFLTAQEKAYMNDRLQYDGDLAVPMDDSFQWAYVRAGLFDWKTWLAFFAYLGSLIPLYSVALTLPSILKTTLGYNALAAQYMTVPIYIVAAITVLIFAYLSDKFSQRCLFLALGCGLSAIGWIIGLTVSDGRAKYAACFLSAMGSYAGFPSVVALVSQNVGGKTQRSVALGVLVGIGGFAGIASSNIFMAKEAPLFTSAYKINIALNLMAVVVCGIMAFALTAANKRKQAMIDSGEAAKMSRQEIAAMGDKSPYFKYRI